MPAFLVGYDLNKPDQEYGPLIEKLKSYPAWWHHLDSTWFVVANTTATGLRDELTPHIGTSDELLVMNVTDDDWATFGIKRKGIDWLQRQLVSSCAA